MSDSTLLQSPLIELEKSGRFQWVGDTIELHQSPFMGHIRIRGDLSNPLFVEKIEQATALPLPASCGGVSFGEDRKIIWISPEEWLLVLSSESRVGSMIDRLKTRLEGEHIAFADTSGGQTVIRVSGENAISLLSRGTSLDLHESQFLVGSSAQSILFGATVLIVRVNSNHSTPLFELYCRRSFADDLARRLIDSAQLIK